MKHISEKRWREVFLLVAERMDSADYLLIRMKQQIDQMLTEDDKLQAFLTWVEQKSRSVEASYKPAAIRAFYFALVHDIVFVRNITLARAFVLSRNITRDFVLSRNITRDFNRNFDLDCTIARALAIVRDIDLARDLDRDIVLVLSRALARDLDCALARDLDRAPELQQKLQLLRSQLPESSKENEIQFKQWWKTEGKAWTEQLRGLMLEHQNIGHNWQFTSKQHELLKQYYIANKLLVECLNSGSVYVTKERRHQIEAELLLPVSRN